MARLTTSTSTAVIALGGSRAASEHTSSGSKLSDAPMSARLVSGMPPRWIAMSMTAQEAEAQTALQLAGVDSTLSPRPR